MPAGWTCAAANVLPAAGCSDVVIIDRVPGLTESTSLKADMTFDGPFEVKMTMQHDLATDSSGADTEHDDSERAPNDRSVQRPSAPRVPAVR